MPISQCRGFSMVLVHKTQIGGRWHCQEVVDLRGGPGKGIQSQLPQVTSPRACEWVTSPTCTDQDATDSATTWSAPAAIQLVNILLHRMNQRFPSVAAAANAAPSPFMLSCSVFLPFFCFFFFLSFFFFTVFLSSGSRGI